MTPAPRLQDRLRACPWCGHGPTVHYVGDEDGGYHEVACYTPHTKTGSLFCGVHTDTEEEAITAWNARPELDRLEKLVEEARQQLEYAIGNIEGCLAETDIPSTAIAAHGRSLLSRMNKETGD